jgi:LytS/YehU family sensor histidine kinase
MVALVNSLHAYKELQKEKNKSVALEKALITSRMHFLKQQLQPHFLFNTHHSIITLMKLGEKDKAIEMMEKLSDLMRFALRENNTQEITLEKELALLELYLDIQKTRFEDKLMVTFDVPQELLAASVPSMMLQPIVENSIKYAVEKSSAGSTIHIRARKISDMLELTVKDRSKEPSQVTDIQKGIGLNNTEERLERLYEKQHHFNIRLYDEEEYGGSLVTIQIPLHYA